MRSIREVRPLLCFVAFAMMLGCEGAPTAETATSLRYSYAAARGNVRLATTSTYNEYAVSGDAVINKAGGSLRVGKHQLVVPRGAVAHPTRFTMTVETGDNVILDLHAVDLVTGAAVSTFPISLQVRLNYDDVPISRDELRKLVVVWLQDDTPTGTLVPVRTTHIQAERYAVGWVNHFSKFAMGMN